MWLLIGVINWNKDSDWLANHFLGRISEDPLRSLIPTCHDAFQVHANDGIISGRNNRRQEKPIPLGYFQSFAFADVVLHGYDTYDLSDLITDWREGHGHLDEASIFVYPASIIILRAFASPNALPNFSFLFTILGHNQDLERFSDDVIGRVSEDAFPCRIPRRDNAI